MAELSPTDGYETAEEARRMLDGITDLVSAAPDLHQVGSTELGTLLYQTSEMLRRGLAAIARGLYTKQP